jgi:hypothetical protein
LGLWVPIKGKRYKNAKAINRGTRLRATVCCRRLSRKGSVGGKVRNGYPRFRFSFVEASRPSHGAGVETGGLFGLAQLS